MAYFNFHQDDIEEFRAAFLLFDASGKGHITMKNLELCLRCLEPKPTESELRKILQEVEREQKNGGVSFSDYLNTLQKTIDTCKKHNKEKPKRKRSCHTNLSEEQIEEIREAFNKFDQDGDGTITITELKTVLSSMGQEVDENDIKVMLEDLDTTNGNTIEFPAFLTMMTMKVDQKDLKNEILQTFQFFDKDGDGSITGVEVKEAMLKLGEDLTEEEIAEMVKEADVDGDGRIDYSEFVKMISWPK
ncbi:calmodulin-A-like [Hydractinia symbiolongicarpus]|uniref:calmodulin-A-like n=1 Tax=Hydractinia symbiolongicarpus TaxID=13093 RepID=UPI00254B165D|nr:calmodulin-A-like [Hydractinia symbiolongicarpus]